MIKTTKKQYPKGTRRSKLLTSVSYIDYKDPILATFVDIYGRIVPRRYSGLSVKKQKQLARAIKRARIMGLLPFVK